MSVAGWTPLELIWRDGGPRLLLRDLRGVRFDDPFFTQTVERALREPYRQLFWREAAFEDLAGLRGARPAGFVFHGSRCGSTLLASTLRALDGAIVLSEPAVIDQVLRAPASAEQRAAWLRLVVGALAQSDDDHARCFVKLDSWSVHDMPVVRAAYPEVPWVFVYRDPGEVLRSQLGMRGMQMVPGVLDPALFGIDAAMLAEMAPEDYCARVLAAMYRDAAEQLDDRGRLVDYVELPEPGVDAVLAHFGVEPTPRERAAIGIVTRSDAKNPRLAFDPARPDVPVAARLAARRWASAPYERLESLRAAQGSG